MISIVLQKLAITVAAFAISISCTRWISTLSIITSRKLRLGPLAFCALLALHYCLLVVWYPVLLSMYAVILDSYAIFDPQSDVLRGSLATIWVGEEFQWSPIRLASAVRARLLCTVDIDPIYEEPGYDVALAATYAASAFDMTMYCLSNALRIVFALTLLMGFIGREWIGRLFSLTWARLVENEKPVFTVLFSALATFGSTLTVILSHLHS